MSGDTPERVKARLLAALESGELQAQYAEAKAQSDELRRELEASMGPIDPLLLITPVGPRRAPERPQEPSAECRHLERAAYRLDAETRDALLARIEAVEAEVERVRKELHDVTHCIHDVSLEKRCLDCQASDGGERPEDPECWCGAVVDAVGMCVYDVTHDPTARPEGDGNG